MDKIIGVFEEIMLENNICPSGFSSLVEYRDIEDLKCTVCEFNIKS
jgi:hypothetical protein